MNAAVQQVEKPDAGVAPVTDDFDYEAEFNAQVEKREAEKNGTPAEVEDPAKAANEDKKEPVADAAPKAGDAQPAVEPVKPAESDPDWIGLLPEDKRAAARESVAAARAAQERAAKLENDNRSLAGRMSAYQRRYEEAAGKRPVEVAKQATAEQSAEWTQFAQDYPDIAKAIEARYAASLPTGSAVDIQGVVEYVEQEKRDRFLHDAWEAVEAVHPGWRDVGKTKEFQAWKDSSPTYGKLASSDDIADAIALFDLYDAHRVKTGAARQPSAAEAAAASQLAARRNAQAEGARSHPNRAQSPNQNVDLADEDQLFAFYAQKSNARIKARHQ